MSLDAGTRLGPYQILAPLGAGGMGEVYRAHDTRLDRDVAVKVLPKDVAVDATRLERFAQEARATAALNHPNILAVYDVSVNAETPYLVAELLEGATLADRLRDAPDGLSVRRAIEIAQQVANGLAAAHARGIVHRDIKPANLFITADGRVKILDFGLARPGVLGATGAADLSRRSSPELERAEADATRAVLTDPGTVMGSVSYMAPEQVRGQAVDARTDLFAAGAVLHEMLSGRRTFEANTSADIISAVLNRDPGELVSRHDHTIPPALGRIVSRCLEKDPAARFQSAADLAFALQALTLESGATAAVPIAVINGPTRATPRWREAVWASIAAVALTGCAVLWLSRQAPLDSPPLPTALFDAQLPSEAVALRMALSPDGQWLIGSAAGAGTNYWLRLMADGTVQEIPGTGERQGHLGWTADGGAFDFVGRRGINRVRLDDRTVTVLSTAPQWAVPVSGVWSRTHLVIADSRGDVWVKTAADPQAVPTLLIPAGDGVQRRQIAGFARSDTQFLFLQEGKLPAQTGIFVASVEAPTLIRVSEQSADYAEIAAESVLLLKRGESLYAQRLSHDGRSLEGTPSLVTSSIGAAPFSWSASDNGVLTWVPSVDFRFRWYDRAGVPEAFVSTPANWGALDLSRDGRRLVASRPGSGQSANLWSIDIVRSFEERLTFGEDRDGDLAWLGDGSQILMASGPTTNATVAAFRVAPGRAPEKVYEDPRGFALDDWSSDGRWILYHRRQFTDVTRELVAVEVGANEAARTVARCQGSIDEGRFSPDGRWVAFNCNESGRHEVYIVPFLRDGPRVRVSADGGVQPNWRLDQRELFYLAPDGRMMSAALTLTAEAITVTTPAALFDTTLVPSFAGEQYAVAPDGQRFLMKVPAEGAQTLRFLINWPARVLGDGPRP